MKALVFNGALQLDPDYPLPDPGPGEARIRVRKAGICRTDLELTCGYMNFRGVLGHEFVGEVEACADRDWVGARVVGEINAACGACDWCARGLGRHCPDRTVLGILNRDGCMAEYCTLPAANLHRVPPEMPDETAVFTEPVSAACEILEQVPVAETDRCVVLGDGKLGILCAWVLATRSRNVSLVGRHEDHLRRAEWRDLQAFLSIDEAARNPDIVVEATGRAEGIYEAIRLCRPRGTLILKSTVANATDLNLAPVVVNELTVVGSRCGRFEDGLEVLTQHDLPVHRLIDVTYPLDQALQAFEHAARRASLKVLLDVT